MPTVISVENLSKTYRLGQIGTGTLTNDLNVWLARKRGLPNPLLKVGGVEHGNRAGDILWALKEVGFTVEQGEVLGIIGRNGAGKSTLLKILSRVTAPTSGKIKVKGRIASLLEVGTGFHPDLTGRENIFLNGAILGMNRQEVQSKFAEIVAFAEVERYIDTPVKRYSSGMYVRLAFAVAAHLEPEILVVDEVLAVGDAEFQKKCLGKMGAVAREGRTVLFVSHNMASVKNLCRNGILLESGQIKYTGMVDEVVNYYLDNPEKRPAQLLEKGYTLDPLVISSIRLCNQKGNPLDVIPSCSPVQFVLSYSTTTHEPLTHVRLSFRVLDTMNQNLFAFANYLTEEFSIIPPEGVIVCPVPAGLPLTEDSYKVSLAVQIEKGNHTVFNDVLRFIITAADVFGTGQFPDKRRYSHGSFVVPQTPWTVSPQKNQLTENLG